MVVERLGAFLEDNEIGPCRLLIACSGGVDSTALLLAAADLRPVGYMVICAHVNHHLRGADSDADEAFVRTLCESLGVALHVAEGTLDPEEVRRVGVEAAARELRNCRLHEIRSAVQADFIVTAHQKNDQAETVLMRLLTGTGLAGLRGIHPVREDGLLRPLLDVTREEIEAFLADRGVTPRQDRSNEEQRFLRNRVRATLREFGPAAVSNLAAIAEQSRQMWSLVERALDQTERGGVRIRDDETQFVRWPHDRWLSQALLLRHIRRLGSAREVSSPDLERLVESLDNIKRVSVTRDLELVRRGRSLVLRRKPQPAPEFEVALRTGQSAFIPQIGAAVRVSRTSPGQPTTVNRQLFQLPDDADGTFVVRNRRKGDRFRPLGLGQDKKLKDFLIDRKIPAELRDSLALLIWNGEIVWVAGVEVSDRFRVTSPAGELYEATVEHAAREDQESVQR